MNGIFDNLTNPIVLLFILGVFSTIVKSDLKIPKEVSKFLSYLLLFCIGLEGGHKLSHHTSSSEIYYVLGLAIVSSTIIPIYVFSIVKKYFKIQDACALAATFGSVSAVTFITAQEYLKGLGIPYDEYLIAALALMESPAIIIGMILLKKFEGGERTSMKEAVIHSFTNGSVLMLLGCLVIGVLASDSTFEKLEPLTEDAYKGFLGFFILDMGIIAGKRMRDIQKSQIFKLIIIGVVLPLVNVIVIFFVGGWLDIKFGNFLLLLILSSSASYIAVPATMKTAAPSANPGIYTSVALGITFPFNILIGIPLYHRLLELWTQF